jgi:hypothetical protein
MSDHQQSDAEALRLELQEAITSFRHEALLLYQAAGIFAAADSILLAYGFSQKESAILLVASLLPIGLLVIDIEVMTHIVPLAYVAIKLEQKLMLREYPLVATYIQARLPSLLPILLATEKLDGSVLAISRRLRLKTRLPLMLVSAFIAQFLLFLVSLTIFNYRFM